MSSSDNNNKKVDIFRDTPVRYLGYANEVGESFRALIHVNWVRFSYVVSSTYVCADAASKGREMYQGFMHGEQWERKPRNSRAAGMNGEFTMGTSLIGVHSDRDWPDESIRRTKTLYAVVDTMIWQGLASVAIPGFTINRICFATNLLLQKMSSLPTVTRKWTVTAIGLAAIPFIIKPIDHSVDWLMESSLRKWTGNTMTGHHDDKK